MKEEWAISKEDADQICVFLGEFVVAFPKSPDIECIKRVHAALMWADRIVIED